MFAIPRRRRLLGRAALSIGLALVGLGLASGVAAAFPSQPVADDPFLFPQPNPSTTLGESAPLTNTGAQFPILSDVVSALSGGQNASLVDPSTLVPTTLGDSAPLTNSSAVLPMLTDATSFLNAGQDPNAYITDIQNLLSDSGSLGGAPSLIPSLPAVATPASGN